MAIMLDRVTTAASERERGASRREHGRRNRWIGLGAAGRRRPSPASARRPRSTSTWRTFPEDPDLGTPFAEAADSFSSWLHGQRRDLTNAIKDAFTYGLLNPLQSLLAESPWCCRRSRCWPCRSLIGGLRSFLTVVVCIGGILCVGLWQDAMITLTMTLVATILTMILALVLGVWMAQSRAVDLIVRPILDAAQVVPPFVYLVPVLILFGATRFTAIVAAVVYAAPVAIKLVCRRRSERSRRPSSRRPSRPARAAGR